MPTYLLTWNPKKSPHGVAALHQGSEALGKGKKFSGTWSAGNTTTIKRGDRVFLLRQGNSNPGIIGSGLVRSDTHRGPHWDAKARRAGKKALFVDVNWRDMVPDCELDRARLLKGILPATLLKVASSGVSIPPALCRHLEARWKQHLASLRLQSSVAVSMNPYGDRTPIASAAQFKSALVGIDRKGINPKQKAMLCAHLQAPAHTITTHQLAQVVGYTSHGTANMQYGRLAHRIADALQYRPGPFPDGNPHWWRTLANGNEGEPHNPDGHYEWIMRPELVAALQELKWASISGAAKPVAISPLTFDRQFARFKAQLRHHSGGQQFTSFREGLPAKWEDYKEALRNEALRLLAVRTWKRSDIGTGRLLARVIQAIEIHDSSRGLRNNLVAWPNRYGHENRSHHALLDARQSASARPAFEQWSWDFFRGQADEPRDFARLCQLAGERYDLVAYLFFLKDWNRFMPIAPTTFDKGFKLLGVDLVTSHQCSWENYARYNAALLAIQRLLRDVAEVTDARLIDAHSFCWMLVRLDLPAAAQAPSIPLPRAIGNIHPSTRPASTAGTGEDFTVVTEAEFSERDASRRRLGRLAQEVALQSERRRLRELGHPNPDQAARPVWEEPGRGYDILSCEKDNSPRHIEVKAARRSGDKMSYFLSRNEWEQSRTLPNYWFYLVFDTESTRPDVLMIPARALSFDCLAPVNYLASFQARPT